MAERLGVEPVALGFGVDVLDVLAEGRLSSSSRSMRSTIAFSWSRAMVVASMRWCSSLRGDR